LTAPRTWALAAGLVSLVGASPVVAHSLLLESVPAPGAVLAAAPPALMLRFNNRIEPTLSRVRLVDARGSAQPLVVAGSSTAADRLTAAVPPLTPGAWRVEWQVLSIDGHVVSGRFEFRLTPAE
jgi:methionine-rich copper-binding protein CopC